MLNQPFFHSDPPVAGNPSQDENQAEGPPEASAPTGIEIGGERYTEEQVEAALGGLEAVEAAKKQQLSEFHSQTQAIAAKRRQAEQEAEEMTRRAQELLAKAEREFSDESPDESPRLQSIEQKLDQLTRAREEEAQMRASRDAETQRIEAIRAAVDSLDGRPYVNDQVKGELAGFMERNNIDPQHADLVYQASYGPKVAEERGRQQAVRQAGPPMMGAGEAGISPGFTTPQEIPGTEIDVENSSFQDFKRAALNDPEKPNF
jgi:hypothetical protein